MIRRFFVLFVLLLVCSNTGVYAQSSADLDNASADTEINVKNADLEALIRIFSKKTKRNYILDERVKGSVSIYLPGGVSSDEAIHVLDAVLALKGFTAVPIASNIWKIIPASEAKQTTVPIVGDKKIPATAQVVTRFLTLKYVLAENVRELISSLISPYGLISAYAGTNSLILIDSEDNIQRLVKIIEHLDLPATDTDMTIIPINYAEAAQLAETINSIIKEEDADTAILTTNTSGSSASSVRRASLNTKNTTANASTPAAPAQATSLSVAMKARAPKIIADERTNSIIIVADEDTTARVRGLIDQLDSQVDRSGSRFFVYRCQHASAEDLAEVLSGLVGGSGGSSNDSSITRDREQTSEERTAQRLRNQSRLPGQSRADDSSSGSGVSAVALSDEIAITADAATNSLVIQSSQNDYEMLKALLRELDIKRRQVIVEAMILEVMIDESLNFGTEFSSSAGGLDGGVFASNTQGNLTNLFSNPTSLQNFTIAAASSGTLTLPNDVTIPSQSILVRAVQENRNVNVLSAPTILATDNEEAEIVVGQNVPFLASTASNQTDLNNVFNQIDRQDVGITLRITPQISSSDFVTLKMFTEVSDVVQGTAASDLGPTTTVRTSQTTVITKDSQTVVIGGLMSDNVVISDEGIPFLKDIPILGSLFSAESEEITKTNLLIFITPRIVKDQFDAREVTIEKRDRIEEILNEYSVYPDRSKTLHDNRFHEVVDTSIEVQKDLNTIYPPEKQTAEQVSKLSKDQQQEVLAKTEAFNQPVQKLFDDTEDQAQQQDIDNRSGSFVVLERVSDLPAGVWPGYLNSKMVQLHIPDNVGSGIKNFFQQGQAYSFNHNQQQIIYMARGVYSDAAQAGQQFNLPADWYSLTPYELLNLGKSGWMME